MRKLLSALALVSAAFSQAPTDPPPIVQITCQPGYSGSSEQAVGGQLARKALQKLLASSLKWGRAENLVQDSGWSKLSQVGHRRKPVVGGSVGQPILANAT
jgi:hypothetical protein